uniref:Uncharacterized protein n=1 Tax=Parascaris equorum TaxID=6256 RepID=A0A914RMW0_PAREQ
MDRRFRTKQLLAENPSCSSLLLGFDTAKLSVVGFSAAERSLKTISLHCFEEEMLKDGYATDLPSPVIRVDPAQRCAVMLIYGRCTVFVYSHKYSISGGCS